MAKDQDYTNQRNQGTAAEYDKIETAAKIYNESRAQQKLAELSQRQAALIAVLKVFLGHDPRFQVSIGGNPIAVEQFLATARRFIPMPEQGS